MEIFRRQKKISPKDVFEEYGKVIKTNVSSQDLKDGINKQLKRITDPNYRLQELERILPVTHADLEAVITVVSKRLPRKPRRLNMPEQVEIRVHNIPSQETEHILK